MNAKEIKKEIEQTISEKIVEFQDKTGLEVSYVEVNKDKNLGFIVGDKKIEAKIRLKD